jgi:hypothetical protein
VQTHLDNNCLATLNQTRGGFQGGSAAAFIAFIGSGMGGFNMRESAAGFTTFFCGTCLSCGQEVDAFLWNVSLVKGNKEQLVSVRMSQHTACCC